MVVSGLLCPGLRPGPFSCLDLSSLLSDVDTVGPDG